MIHCTVNVKELANKDGGESFRLDDGFFVQFDCEDVVGGSVDVDITAEKSHSAECDYIVDIRMKGVLRVPCTRCLDNMDYDTELEDTVKVVCADGGADSDDEDLLKAKADGTIDLSHRIFETLALNVPSVRVHEEGGCNPAVMKWLESHSAEIQ